MYRPILAYRSLTLVPCRTAHRSNITRFHRWCGNFGAGPASALLPGPYEVIADSRSIEPQGIQAALWTRVYLQPDNRVAADRINQILLGTYGDQRVVTSIEDNIDLSPVFLSV